MNDTLSINIKIDNKGYPLLVSRKDEEKYRNAAKTLNEVVQAFRNEYPEKESRDVLAMAAFQLAYNTQVLKEKGDQQLLVNDLKDMRDDIDDFLAEKSVRRF